MTSDKPPKAAMKNEERKMKNDEAPRQTRRMTDGGSDRSFLLSFPSFMAFFSLSSVGGAALGEG